MLTASVTTTTTHQLVLKPTLKKKLLLALRTYVELRAERKALKLAQIKQAKIVEDIQVEVGESSLVVEGFKSTMVAPNRHQLNKKKFVALGGNLEILEAAMESKPGKAYPKITAPGEQDDDDE